MNPSTATSTPFAPQGQLELGLQLPEKDAVKSWLVGLLKGYAQPPASELLRQAEAEFGWQVRHMLLPVIAELRDDGMTSISSSTTEGHRNRPCGWSGPPFRGDEERRFLLRCELALPIHLGARA